MDIGQVVKEWEGILSRDPLDVPWDLIDDTLTLLKMQEEEIRNLAMALKMLKRGQQGGV